MLQADPKVKAAMAKPAAKKPAAKPAAAKPKTAPAAKPANTMANTPVSVSNKAKPVAKTEPTATTTNVKQKTLTNKGFDQMLGGLTKQNAGVEHKGKIIRENFSIFRKR